MRYQDFPSLPLTFRFNRRSALLLKPGMGGLKSRLGGRRSKVGWVDLNLRIIYFVVFALAATVIRAQEQIELEVETAPESGDEVIESADAVAEEASVSSPALSILEATTSGSVSDTTTETHNVEHATSSYRNGNMGTTAEFAPPKVEAPMVSYNSCVESETLVCEGKWGDGSTPGSCYFIPCHDQSSPV